MPIERLPRRRLLQAGLLLVLASGAAACRRALTPSGGPTGSPPTRTPKPTPNPTRSPAPTPTEAPTQGPTPTPSPTEIAGLLIVGFRGLTLDEAPWIRDALATGGLGGVILFSRDQASGGDRNVRSPAQVAALTAEVRTAAGDRRVLIGIDQEGGVVTRLGPDHGFPPLESQAEIGQGSAAAARSWAWALAGTLADVGIDLDFAPVVDLDLDPDGPAIGALDRAFSADPDVVVEMATIELQAMRAAGVRSTLKHFPGIGSASTNTDFGVADVTDTWTRKELEPYRRLIDAGLVDLVMVGHVVNGQLDPDRPASLSPATVDGLLRAELGWDGVVVTDDLQAAAIVEAFGADEAVVLALEAGVDLLLFANQQSYDDRIIERVVAAVMTAIDEGRLDPTRIDDAVSRLERLLG